MARNPARAQNMGAKGAAYALAEASWRARAKATSEVFAQAMGETAR